MKDRKNLKETQRLITLGFGDDADKSKCCNTRMAKSRIYPRPLYCVSCFKEINYEDEVNFKIKIDKPQSPKD